MSNNKTRKPVAFDPNDPAIQVRPDTQPGSDTEPKPRQTKKSSKVKSPDENPIPDVSLMADSETSASQPPIVIAAAARRTLRWGTVLISASGALVSFAAGLAITDLVESLFARANWLGWTALALAALAGVALMMICIREFTAILRLRRIERLRRDAARATRDNDGNAAKSVVKALKSLYNGRTDCSWGLARLKDAEGQVFDGDDLLKIAERELMTDLDTRAAREIARAARRVSVVTAISPAALIDMGFVLVANLSMLRKLAEIYGARPGAIGLFRLARLALAHLAVTGGIAVGDGLLQQIFGHGIAAKLSARLGEGVLNGLFTTRIGLAALEVCRPLPFHSLAAPSIKELMSEVALPTK